MEFVWNAHNIVNNALEMDFIGDIYSVHYAHKDIRSIRANVSSHVLITMDILLLMEYVKNAKILIVSIVLMIPMFAWNAVPLQH